MYKVFQELNISNVSLFYRLSIQHIPFDEYSNFRYFKKGFLEFVGKILDKYTNKVFLKIPF